MAGGDLAAERLDLRRVHGGRQLLPSDAGEPPGRGFPRRGQDRRAIHQDPAGLHAGPGETYTVARAGRRDAGDDR